MLVHNRDGTQGTIFISYCNTVYNYATCTDEVQFLLLRGGTQLTQYSFVMHLACVSEVKMSGGTQYCIHLLYPRPAAAAP